MFLTVLSAKTPINFLPQKSCTNNTVTRNEKYNIAPLGKDVISFTSKKTITFDNIDFKKKFSLQDYSILKKISKFAQKSNINVYLVGGVVRDMLLGKQADDLDFLIEGDALEFTKKLHEEYPEIEIVYLKDDFGTTKIKINNSDIDLASTREESYIKKAIPKVKNIGCSIKKDVQRRDFTINAMALKIASNKQGEIVFTPVDFSNGLEDLNNGIISATYGNSFNDDPTRIIRGLRFRLKYGFKYDSKTQKMQDDYLINPPINEISKSRIDTALRKLFKDEKMAPAAFNALINEKIYKLFSEEILAKNNWGERIQKACEIFEVKNVANVYIKLLDNNEVKKVGNYKKEENLSNYEIFKKFHRMTNEELAIYFSVTNDSSTVKFYKELRQRTPILKGKDLIQVGYRPGKGMGIVLEKLLEAKLDNTKIDTLKDELQFVKAL